MTTFFLPELSYLESLAQSVGYTTEQKTPSVHPWISQPVCQVVTSVWTPPVEEPLSVTETLATAYDSVVSGGKQMLAEYLLPVSEEEELAEEFNQEEDYYYAMDEPTTDAENQAGDSYLALFTSIPSSIAESFSSFMNSSFSNQQSGSSHPAEASWLATSIHKSEVDKDQLIQNSVSSEEANEDVAASVQDEITGRFHASYDQMATRASQMSEYSIAITYDPTSPIPVYLREQLTRLDLDVQMVEMMVQVLMLMVLLYLVDRHLLNRLSQRLYHRAWFTCVHLPRRRSEVRRDRELKKMMTQICDEDEDVLICAVPGDGAGLKLSDVIEWRLVREPFTVFCV